MICAFIAALDHWGHRIIIDFGSLIESSDHLTAGRVALHLPRVCGMSQADDLQARMIDDPIDDPMFKNDEPIQQ